MSIFVACVKLVEQHIFSFTKTKTQKLDWLMSTMTQELYQPPVPEPGLLLQSVREGTDLPEHRKGLPQPHPPRPLRVQSGGCTSPPSLLSASATVPTRTSAGKSTSPLSLLPKCPLLLLAERLSLAPREERSKKGSWGGFSILHAHFAHRAHCSIP